MCVKYPKEELETYDKEQKILYSIGKYRLQGNTNALLKSV